MAFNTSTSTGARRREPRHNEGSGRGTRDSAEVVLLIVAVVVAFAAAAGCADPVEATYPDPTSANVATVRGGIEAVVVRPDIFMRDITLVTGEHTILVSGVGTNSASNATSLSGRTPVRLARPGACLMFPSLSCSPER